jgi:ABC-type dipeptide/oligopeptide/nickel transport system ATPase component
LKIDDIFLADGYREKLLTVSSLRTAFFNQDRAKLAVREVGFQVANEQAVALVGMSGSGKTVSIHSIFALVSPSPGVIGGQAWFQGQNLLDRIQESVQERTLPDASFAINKSMAWEKKFRRRAGRYLGKEVGFVFQEPVQALDPFFTVGQQLMEVYRKHNRRLSFSEAQERCHSALRQADIAAPERVFRAYPHELSGGICQRIVILLALAGNPSLLIADEPTTALDVVTQREILDVLFHLKAHHGLSILFITHDVRLLREKFDRIAVLCDGSLVEWGGRQHFFNGSEIKNHPHTRMLFGANDSEGPPGIALQRPAHKPSAPKAGCPHRLNCWMADPTCGDLPEFTEVEPGHFVRCPRV